MTTQPTTLSGEDNMRWVDEHVDDLRDYQGLWIAVVDCRVVAAGDSVDEILAEVERQDLWHPFVTKIPTDAERNAIFIG